MRRPTDRSLELLLVEDNPGDADLVSEQLAEAVGDALRIRHVDRVKDALAVLETDGVDVVLLDLSLPDASGLAGLRRLRAARPDLPVVVLTGGGDEALGVLATQEGAQDYFLKGELGGRQLARAIRHAVERSVYAERARLLAREQAARAEAEQAARRAALLAEVSKALGSTLDAEAAVTAVLGLLVPALGSWCCLEIVEDDPTGEGVLVHCHAHPPLAPGMAARTIRRDAPALIEARILTELSDEVLADLSTHEQDADLLRARGLAGGLTAPIEVRGQVLGRILVLTEQPGRLGEQDLGLLEEIGRRTAAAVENARLYRQAREASAVREEFLSVASHELRTPLTTLQLHVELLERTERRAPGDEASRTRMRMIQGASRQVERLAQLVESLLDVSRLSARSASHRDENIEHLDLAELVRTTVTRVAEQAPAGAGVTLIAASQPVTGSWDPLLLERVVGNLVSNAFKYGLGRPIEVEVVADGDDAVVRVSDHGIGIPAEKLDSIFGRFERAVSGREYGGLGLGLYIVRQLVEAQGGTISVSSRVGEGSTFTVRLPREQQRAEAGTHAWA